MVPRMRRKNSFSKHDGRPFQRQEYRRDPHRCWPRMSVDLRTAPVRDVAQSGSAGNYQWGLDTGNNQDGWDPYAELSSHWNHEDRNEGDPDWNSGDAENISGNQINWRLAELEYASCFMLLELRNGSDRCWSIYTKSQHTFMAVRVATVLESSDTVSLFTGFSSPFPNLTFFLATLC